MSALTDANAAHEKLAKKVPIAKEIVGLRDTFFDLAAEIGLRYEATVLWHNSVGGMKAGSILGAGSAVATGAAAGTSAVGAGAALGATAGAVVGLAVAIITLWGGDPGDPLALAKRNETMNRWAHESVKRLPLPALAQEQRDAAKSVRESVKMLQGWAPEHYQQAENRAKLADLLAATYSKAESLSMGARSVLTSSANLGRWYSYLGQWEAMGDVIASEKITPWVKLRAGSVKAIRKNIAAEEAKLSATVNAFQGITRPPSTLTIWAFVGAALLVAKRVFL